MEKYPFYLVNFFISGAQLCDKGSHCSRGIHDYSLADLPCDTQRDNLYSFLAFISVSEVTVLHLQG